MACCQRHHTGSRRFMRTFILRRAFFLLFVLFGVSVLLFGILMTFSPERRAAAYVTTPQQAKDIPKIIQQFGLDDPVHVQYLRWIREVARGNLGWSLVAARPVELSPVWASWSSGDRWLAAEPVCAGSCRC